MLVALLTGERETEASEFSGGITDDNIYSGIPTFYDNFLVGRTFMIYHLAIDRASYQQYEARERAGHPLVGWRGKIVSYSNAPVLSSIVVSLETVHHNPDHVNGLQRLVWQSPREIAGACRRRCTA